LLPFAKSRGNLTVSMTDRSGSALAVAHEAGRAQSPAGKKKILFVVHRVPYPPDRGDRIRSWNILKHLAQRANVWLACLSDEPVAAAARSALEPLCQELQIEN